MLQFNNSNSNNNNDNNNNNNYNSNNNSKAIADNRLHPCALYTTTEANSVALPGKYVTNV